MFKKLLFAHGVKNHSGISIKFKGLHNIEYREGAKISIAFRERLVGDPGMDIDSSSIASWEPPFDKDLIPDAKKQEILENICQAADVLGITYLIR
jgi:hypothetical protein